MHDFPTQMGRCTEMAAHNSPNLARRGPQELCCSTETTQGGRRRRNGGGMAARLLRDVASAAARSARGHRIPDPSGSFAGPGSRGTAPAAQVCPLPPSNPLLSFLR